MLKVFLCGFVPTIITMQYLFGCPISSLVSVFQDTLILLKSSYEEDEWKCWIKEKGER